MTTLTGKTIQDTYKDLLQVSNVNQGIDTTVRAVEDGEGTASQFFLSTTIARIGATGTLDFATGGGFDVSNLATVTGTWADLGTVTTVDINGGTADSFIIGAVTPANGTFSIVFTNTIDESTADAGVTIDSFLIKDGLAAALSISYSNTTSNLTATTVQAAVDEIISKASVQTTDATKTKLFGIAVASGESSKIHFKLTAVQSGTPANMLMMDIIAAAENTGGTTTLIIDGTGYNAVEGGATAWVVETEANDSTDELEINVTGVVATTIDWDVNVQEIG